MPLEEVYKSTSVIRASVNEIRMGSYNILPYFRSFCGTFQDLIAPLKFNKATRIRIEELMPEELKKDNKVLGGILRGTDYREEAISVRKQKTGVAKLEKMIEKCNFIMNLYGFQYVFVATEDLKYFEKMKEIFGDRCLYIEQKRVYYDYSTGHKFCSELLALEDGKDFGRRYLAVIQSLACCKALLSNMINNGTTSMAIALNNSKYEYCEVVCP